jgi:mono/diheme cytochrome c family protein
MLISASAMAPPEADLSKQEFAGNCAICDGFNGGGKGGSEVIGRRFIK